MAKNRAKNSPMPPTPITVQKFPRLDGDDLFAWAQIISEESHVAQTKQALAMQFLEKRGFTPGEYLLSNDGYIVSQQEVRAQSRVRTLPAVPTGAQHEFPGEPQRPSDSTDSAT